MSNSGLKNVAAGRPRARCPSGSLGRARPAGSDDTTVVMSFTRFALILGLALVSRSLLAQEPAGLREDLLRELRHAERRAVSLAEAIPAAKYSWRPAEGVRSVSEVLMHLVVNKHFLLQVTGVPAPVGMDRDLEKTVTDKQKVVAMLREAYQKAIERISQSDAAEWNRPVKFFWEPATVRTIYLRLVIHSNEHVGQLIAYARMNGIVPPWSRER